MIFDTGGADVRTGISTTHMVSSVDDGKIIRCELTQELLPTPAVAENTLRVSYGPENVTLTVSSYNKGTILHH